MIDMRFLWIGRIRFFVSIVSVVVVGEKVFLTGCDSGRGLTDYFVHI